MATLDSYLLRLLSLSILGVLAVLVGLDALSALIDDLGDLSPTYGFADALIYVAYTIPRRIGGIYSLCNAHRFADWARATSG